MDPQQTGQDFANNIFWCISLNGDFYVNLLKFPMATNWYSTIIGLATGLVDNKPPNAYMSQ